MTVLAATLLIGLLFVLATILVWGLTPEIEISRLPEASERIAHGRETLHARTEGRHLGWRKA